MLKITLNKSKPQAKKIVAEEQTVLRAGKITTEQIFNLHILCEKYLQQQQDLYHVFIDYKKAFDRVWHAALWATMKKYNISTNLIQVIKNLFNKATNAALFNSSNSSTAAKETGSEQQLESSKDVYSHPSSSTYFWKGS